MSEQSLGSHDNTGYIVMNEPYNPENHRGQGLLGFDRRTAEEAAADKLFRDQNNPFTVTEAVAEAYLETPENLSHEESIATFYEAWKMPDDINRRQLGQFFDVAVRVRDNLLDDNQVSRVGAVMQQLQWLYFGPKPELPVGTALLSPTARYENQFGLVSTVVALAPGDLNAITSKFNHFGLADIHQERVNIRTRQAALAALYSNVITTSPQHKFLMAFENVPSQITDRPLTAFEKQIETAKAEADIRQRYGLARTEVFSAITPFAARQELARENYKIDESVRHHKAESASPLDNARNFFLKDVRGWISDLPDKELRTLYNQLSKESGLDPFIRENYAGHLNRQLAGEKTEIFDGTRLISAYLDRLFDKNTTQLSECRQYSMQRFNIQPSTTPFIISERFLSAEQLIRLRGGAESQYVTLEASNNVAPIEFMDFFRPDRLHKGDIAHITSQAEYEKLARRVVATVVRRPGLEDTENRLIRFRSKELTYSEEAYRELLAADTSDYDLALNFVADPHLAAEVAGYKLAAIRGSTMYFRQSDEHDPYKLPDQVMTSSERQALIRVFETNGATALVDAISSRDKLLISELNQLIYQNSDYSFDQTYNTAQSGPMRGVGVKAGRLQLQCDGAALIMRDMLNRLSGEPSATIVSGLLLVANSSEVMAATHAQVEWRDFTKAAWRDAGGRVYIFDGTPGGNGGPIPKASAGRQRQSRIARLLGRRSLVRSSVAEPSAPVLINETVIPVVLDVESAKPERTVDDIIEQLEFNVRAVLGADSRDSMYDKVVTLKQADPIRRTLEAALQLRRSGVSAEDLTKLSGYLNGLNEADSQTLNQLGLPQYQSVTLQMLQSFVQQLSSVSKV